MHLGLAFARAVVSNLLALRSMPIKKSTKKLQLNRETIQILDDDALGRAHGGDGFLSIWGCKKPQPPGPQPQPHPPGPQPSFGFCTGPITIGPGTIRPAPQPSIGFCTGPIGPGNPPTRNPTPSFGFCRK